MSNLGADAAFTEVLDALKQLNSDLQMKLYEAFANLPPPFAPVSEDAVFTAPLELVRLESYKTNCLAEASNHGSLDEECRESCSEDALRIEAVIHKMSTLLQEAQEMKIGPVYSAVLAIDVQALCENRKVMTDDFAVTATFAAQHTSLDISSDRPVAMVTAMQPPACKASRAGQ